MFSNFLYFLIALVIYTSSDLFETVKNPDSSVIYYGITLTAIFALVCNVAFKRLNKASFQNYDSNADELANLYVNRLSIFALIIFAVNIWGLRLNHSFSNINIFETIPTLKAILFLGLFLFYLIIIWNEAYQIQKRYFARGLTKKDFIFSNVSFSLPALLPWFCLSLIADAAQLLPWPFVKEFLSTPKGEIGYMVLFIGAIAIFGPVLIQKLWNCKPLEQGYARSRIEHICNVAGMKYRNILKWELFGGTMVTAGVMGLIGKFRYLLVTPALLTSLNDDEIDAVMMHEIGHVQKHHMVFYLFFFGGFIACNFVFFEPVMLLLYIFEPAYRVLDIVGISKTSAHPILIGLSLIAVFVLYFRYVFGFFMRNFERQADIHLYQFSSDATPLISTFYKIASFSKQSMEKPNWHHYSIGQRIRFLKKCQSFPTHIRTHHLKVKKLILGYFMLIAVICSLGYSISYGPAKEMFGNFIAEKILFQQLDVDPENSDLYSLVGDYYYGKDDFERAISSYENVLAVDPENIHALNNLSWLLSTCPKLEYRDKSKALEYASRAVERKREDFVLDTYAEALFANNDIPNAIIAAKEALRISKNKKSYYQDQLKRFEDDLVQ